jgi:iron complex transport system substrate-binding protein
MKMKFISVLVLLIAIFSVGCSFTNNDVQQNENVIVDSVGRKIKLHLPIKRAVVANSHNTELINSIGNAIDKVVGVDSGIYQDKNAYGDRFKEENLIGQNQRALNYEKIINLAPDVLIISGNGYWQEAEKQLEPFGIKVVVLNAYYTGEFRKNCELVGKLFGYEKEADEFATYFENKIDYIKECLRDVPKRTLYFEYRNQNTTVTPGRPYYKMVEFSGAKNIFDDADSPYIDSEAVIMRNPQYIVKASESNVRGQYKPPSEKEFILRKEHLIERPGWDGIDAVKNDRILLLSHYAFGGAAELVGTCYIAKFLYPEYLPNLHPEEVFKEWVTKYQHLPYIKGHTYPAFSLDD